MKLFKNRQPSAQPFKLNEKRDLVKMDKQARNSMNSDQLRTLVLSVDKEWNTFKQSRRSEEGRGRAHLCGSPLGFMSFNPFSGLTLDTGIIHEESNAKNNIRETLKQFSNTYSERGALPSRGVKKLNLQSKQEKPQTKIMRCLSPTAPVSKLDLIKNKYQHSTHKQ